MLLRERTTKMINPPKRERRVYRTNFSMAYLEVPDKVVLRCSLLVTCRVKQIAFQWNVPGEPLYKRKCGEGVNRGGKWGLAFPEKFSFSDKN
jgi:hypothetical protein